MHFSGENVTEAQKLKSLQRELVNDGIIQQKAFLFPVTKFDLTGIQTIQPMQFGSGKGQHQCYCFFLYNMLGTFSNNHSAD